MRIFTFLCLIAFTFVTAQSQTLTVQNQTACVYNIYAFGLTPGCGDDGYTNAIQLQPGATINMTQATAPWSVPPSYGFGWYAVRVLGVTGVYAMASGIADPNNLNYTYVTNQCTGTSAYVGQYALTTLNESFQNCGVVEVIWVEDAAGNVVVQIN